MIQYMKYLHRLEKFTNVNSPTLLTGVGVAGTVLTAYLTGKASFKAAEVIQNEQFKQNVNDEKRPLTFGEKTKLTWKHYVPAATTGAVTVTSIIMANQIGAKRTAAIAAAFAISERGFDEYKAKVLEKLKETKANEIHDEIVQDRIHKNPPRTNEVIITGGGEVMCFESFTGRYFKSDMETLRKAQNDINYRILNLDGYASLSEFYDLIGLAHTSASDELGWNCDKLMEINFTTVLSDDDKPCIAIEYHVVPIRGFYRIH